MPSYIVKVSPDADEYVYWSDVVEDVHCIGTRAEVEDYMREIGHGDELPDRFARADKTGTSARPGFYDWSDSGFVAQQRGFLPRARLAEFARLRCADDDRAWELLEPFEDGGRCPVHLLPDCSPLLNGCSRLVAKHSDDPAHTDGAS